MKLGYGLLSGQRSPGDPRSWQDVYDETLVLAEDADRLGIDSIWTTEHHFVDDGYMPSLLVMSAAIAARTTRVRIGTGVLLAPMYHPLRLAEDAATVELLSHGRLVLGVGLGWSATEYSALGADKRRRGKAMDEILPILQKAWSGEPVDHQGDVYRLDRVAVRPTPGTRIPVVVGGNLEPAVRRAARLADGFYSPSRRDTFLTQIAQARDEMERVGRDPSGFWWINQQTAWVCDDADEGWEEALPFMNYVWWKYSDMEASAGRGPGPLPEAVLDMDAATAMRRQVLIGPAEQIAEHLAEVRAAAGVPFDFIARSYFPGMPFSQQREQLARQAEELAPLLAEL